MKLLRPVELTLEAMGEDIARVIPCGDPVLHRSDISVEEQMKVRGDHRPVIPVCQPSINGNEKKYVNECLDGNWISSAGRFIRAFEDAFASACQTEHGIACTSGTSALHLALATMDLGPGDEVILPTFTMIATVNAVAYMGATPVLVDSESATWNVDLNQVEDSITMKTRLVIPV